MFMETSTQKLTSFDHREEKKKSKNRYGSSRRRTNKNSEATASRNTLIDVSKNDRSSEDSGLTMGQLQSRKYLEKLLLRNVDHRLSSNLQLKNSLRDQVQNLVRSPHLSPKDFQAFDKEISRNVGAHTSLLSADRILKNNKSPRQNDYLSSVKYSLVTSPREIIELPSINKKQSI